MCDVYSAARWRKRVEEGSGREEVEEEGEGGLFGREKDAIER